MKDIVQEYLAMRELQELEKKGIETTYTGWEMNNGFERLYEVTYRPIDEVKEAHICRIFDLVKISDETYRCHICKKIHDQQGLEELKKTAPVRNCCCDGFMKKMKIHIPHPLSGWITHPIFYVCDTCGGKYMYHRFICENKDCNNYCDITEVYCLDCQK